MKVFLKFFKKNIFAKKKSPQKVRIKVLEIQSYYGFIRFLISCTGIYVADNTPLNSSVF